MSLAMTQRSFLAAVLGLASLGGGCTDADLFSSERGLGEIDRVALSGRICTEDPLEADLPVRVIITGDRASGGLFADFDPAGRRIEILSSFVQSALVDDDLTLAVLGFGGRTTRLAPPEDRLTRNPGELLAGINQLGLPQPCNPGGLCRDPVEALRATRALIEGDLEQTPAGIRISTQYVVLFMTGGPADPIATQNDCCEPDDAACLDQDPEPSVACQRELELAELTGMIEAVRDAGAIDLRFHVLHFAADTPGRNNSAQEGLESLAFAGRGTYQRFDAISGLGPSSLNVLDTRQALRVKTLYVDNPYAHPTSEGPVVDSDADGLSDAEELTIGTTPQYRDTDGDGIGDLTEVLVGFDPLTPDEPPSCADVDNFRDQDLDGLWDCDEALLGTESTVVDSDGDGMPDALEVIGRVDYLNADAEADADGDGVPNGEEIRQRSDPRSTDVRSHLSFGYRAELTAEGVQTELAVLPVDSLRTLSLFPSEGSTAGVGVIRWDPNTRTLTWQDGSDGDEGPEIAVDPLEGEELPDGGLLLPSSSYAEVQGDGGRFLRALVDPTEEWPEEPLVEQVRVVERERDCLTYTVRNVRLMETLALVDPADPDVEIEPAGLNRLLVYFAEATPERPNNPGPFRIAEVPVLYTPPVRDPSAAVLNVLEDEFVRPRLQP